jgi:carboxylesterase type B
VFGKRLGATVFENRLIVAATGPTVDNSYVKGHPAVLLAKGYYNRAIKLMTGHNVKEGTLFASPFVTGQESYLSYVSQLIPAASSALLSVLGSKTYPENYNGTYHYTTPAERCALTYDELAISCNTQYLQAAFSHNISSYLFSVPQAWHSNDEGFTFFDSSVDAAKHNVNVSVARLMQKYFINFAVSGSPNVPIRVPEFPQFHSNQTVMNFNSSNLGPHQDIIDSTHCGWWQSALETAS